MEKVLSIAQIVLSVLVIVTILLQQKGEGLSGIFGGQGEFFATRRGLEKTIFVISIVLTILLAASVVLSLIWA